MDTNSDIGKVKQICSKAIVLNFSDWIAATLYTITYRSGKKVVIFARHN